MSEISKDLDVLVVLAKRMAEERVPRALEIKERVDRGEVLSDLIGASGYRQKVDGLAASNLVQQGGELGVHTKDLYEAIERGDFPLESFAPVGQQRRGLLIGFGEQAGALGVDVALGPSDVLRLPRGRRLGLLGLVDIAALVERGRGLRAERPAAPRARRGRRHLLTE